MCNTIDKKLFLHLISIDKMAHCTERVSSVQLDKINECTFYGTSLVLNELNGSIEWNGDYSDYVKDVSGTACSPLKLNLSLNVSNAKFRICKNEIDIF